MEEKGVKKLYILDDKQVYGVGVAKTTADAAKLNGIEVVGTDSIDPKAANYRSLASKIKAIRAPTRCSTAESPQNNAVQLYKDLGAALPDATLWGPDGVAESAFTNDLPADVAEAHVHHGRHDQPEGLRRPRVRSSSPTSRRQYKQKVIQPYAIYGFEAMDVILDSMDRAGEKCNDRQAVIDEFFKTKGKVGVTGRTTSTRTATSR